MAQFFKKKATRSQLIFDVIFQIVTRRSSADVASATFCTASSSSIQSTPSSPSSRRERKEKDISLR